MLVVGCGSSEKETEGNMVFVEGGTFQMGSNSDYNELPVHTVTVSSFYMDKTEVTQAEYRKVMGKNPSRFSGCDDCPVESVSWHDANEYAKKVGKRLPTEAEWEYAARGGSKSKGYTYSGSNGIDAVGWYDDNSDDKTHPVAQKQPNELGLYDMSGNVWEWCSDRYGSYSSSPQNNPQGPNSGSVALFAVVAGTAASAAVGLPIASGTIRTSGATATAFVWFFRRTDVSPYPLIPP
jgi:formylglycine-generating enzyme required for sulfatase activity